MTTWERHLKILYLVVNQINDPKIENNLFGNFFISAGAFKLRKQHQV